MPRAAVLTTWQPALRLGERLRLLAELKTPAGNVAPGLHLPAARDPARDPRARCPSRAPRSSARSARAAAAYRAGCCRSARCCARRSIRASRCGRSPRQSGGTRCHSPRLCRSESLHESLQSGNGRAALTLPSCVPDLSLVPAQPRRPRRPLLKRPKHGARGHVASLACAGRYQIA